MGAAQQALEIEQGSNFQFVVNLVGGPSDLTGYTGKCQIREVKASSAVLFETTSITVDALNRQAVLTIPYTATATFTWTRGVYDILLTAGDSSAAYRIAEGKVVIDKSVTREG